MGVCGCSLRFIHKVWNLQEGLKGPHMAGKLRGIRDNLPSSPAKWCHPPEGKAATKLMSELVKLNLELRRG